MRKLAFASLALAAACGRQVQGVPAPLDTFYKPTGIAFHDPWLLVASSNFDLLYEGDQGGTVISVDPSRNPAAWKGGASVASFTGDLAVTGAGCGSTPYAFVASRYSNALYQLTIDPIAGQLVCDPTTPCEIPLKDVGAVTDPLAIETVCAGGRQSAFVAFLRSYDGRGWVSEYTLAHELRTFAPVIGPVRSFRYDPVHDRLWMAVLATATRPPLSWVELGGNCRIDVAPSDGGCSIGGVLVQQLPAGLEIHGIAFANPAAPGQDTSTAETRVRVGVQRVYLTGRLYDVGAAATAGGRTVDLGGLLVVADLVDNAVGGLDMQVVRTIQIGRGAGEIRVLPQRRDASGNPMRDVVAALATDDGELWLYDDETLTTSVFGRDEKTGAPVLGHVPYSIAVGPTTGDVVKIYVGSFQDSLVTAIDVPLSAPEDACMLKWSDLLGKEECIGVGDQPRRITGGARP